MTVLSELPRADGKRFVVTGGGAGIGYFTSERLAGLGARVTIAARNAGRAQQAIDAIRGQQPDADVAFLRLDLADLGSVREAAAAIRDGGPVDGIVANAGVLPWDAMPDTADGFEPAFGTNQLGHFALLAEAFSALSPDAGLVFLGSTSRYGMRLDLDDLQPRRIPKYARYGRSKLAVMTTAVELDRRLRAAGSGVRSLIAHPGYASGTLDPVRPGIAPEPGPAWFRTVISAFANSKQAGAEASAAALLLGASGEFWGPRGFLHLSGAPARERLSGPVLDPNVGARLWAASEALTGVEWTVPPAR